MHGELVGKIGAGARGLDGIEIADQVGDRDIGRGELFDVALVARHPRDGRSVAALGDQVARVLRDGPVGIVANLRSGNIGRNGIEQFGQCAQDAALGLAAQAEQDEVLAREDGVDDLRHDGVVKADDAGEDRVANFSRSLVLQAADEIGAQLVLDAAADMGLREFLAGAQFGQASWEVAAAGVRDEDIGWDMREEPPGARRCFSTLLFSSYRCGPDRKDAGYMMCPLPEALWLT